MKMYDKKTTGVIENTLNGKMGMNHKTNYDLRKPEEVREYLETLMAMFMKYCHYSVTLNMLLDKFDESIEYYDPNSLMARFIDHCNYSVTLDMLLGNFDGILEDYYCHYDITLDPLFDYLNERVDYYDTDSYLSFCDLGIDGDDEVVNAYDNLRETTSNFSDLSDSALNKVLSEILKVVKNENEERKIKILGKNYSWDGELEDIEEFEELFMKNIYDYLGRYNKEVCIEKFKERLDECFEEIEKEKN